MPAGRERIHLNKIILVNDKLLFTRSQTRYLHPLDTILFETLFVLNAYLIIVNLDKESHT